MVRTPDLGSVSTPALLHGQIIAAACPTMPPVRVRVSPGADFGTVLVEAAQRMIERLRLQQV